MPDPGPVPTQTDPTAAACMMRDRDIIIIGSIDWSVHRQTNHRVAAGFAATGNRVLFVENTGIRAPRLKDLWRIKERFLNWRRGTRGFADVEPGITILSPLLIPLPYNRLATRFNRFVLSRSIRAWMRASHFRDPVLITFLPTPLAQGLIRDLDPAVVVYYCANDMANSDPPDARVRRCEEALFREADAVFVISEALRERASAVARHVYSFPSGVEFERFEAARLSGQVAEELADLRRPIIGYVGTLGDVLDQDLLVQATQRLPDATFVFVGPPYSDLRRLEARPNVCLLGGRAHDQVPAFMNGFDVALIPYVRTPFTDSVYSCKLNEYLAVGVPVVATDQREIRHFVERHGPVVEVGRDADEFVTLIERALADRSEITRANRIAAARSNSWDRRFVELSQVVEAHLQRRQQGRRVWHKALVTAAAQSRRRLLRYVTGATLCYALLFHSPVVWWLGDLLAIREAPRPADAIVVFSGTGESAYVNPGYQRRALDALKYYRAGYAPWVVLSSGKEQTIAEVEIMRSVIVDKGVPASAVRVIDRYPHNTYEAVRIMRSVLRERGCRSILFITAPYASRRASWIWKKVAPELDVATVSVIDTPSAIPQWRADLSQMNAVAYEYAAIAYNWWNGWL